MNVSTNTCAQFELGRVVATPGALEFMEQNRIDVQALLARHASGDWGQCQDPEMNEAALNDGSRILSVYKFDTGDVWVMTDAESDACPACWTGVGECEPDKGTWQGSIHFRDDLEPRRLATTVMLPEDY